MCLWTLAVFSALAGVPLLCQAQKVVVQNAGGGRKQELVYDASGRVTETRTLGPDGTLESRDSVEYKPGFFVPDLTNIGYWPDGKKVKTFSHVTFDQNANFTSELIETYDDTGKHVGGHRLIHYPETGVFRCWDWNGTAQAYKSIHCPAAAESGSEPQELERITRAKAAQYIAAARRKAAAERKSHSVPLGRPTIAPGSTHDLNVGIVLPSHLVPGERVSGTVVQDLGPYQELPDLTLIPMTIPVDSSAEATPLRGWEVHIVGAKPQPADAPFSFLVPRDTAHLTVTLRQLGSPARSLSRPVPVLAASAKMARSTSFEAPLVVVKDRVAEVRGPFRGDATQIFASVDAEPAAMMASTPQVAFFHISDETSAGQRNLILADGTTLVAIPLVVAEVRFQPEPETVTEGQPRLFIFRVFGLDQLPEKYWRPGIFPPSSVEEAQKLVPGFPPPSAASSHSPENKHESEEVGSKKDTEGHDAKESANTGEEDRKQSEGDHDEAHSGVVLLVIKNASPENASLRGSKDQRFAFTLTPDSFEQGEFMYKFVADPLRSGSFSVERIMIPFLAPSTSSPFKHP